MNRYSKFSNTIQSLKTLNHQQLFKLQTPHFNLKNADSDYIENGSINIQKYALPHQIWTKEQVQNIELEDRRGKKFGDKFALKFANIFCKNLDILSGYKRIFPWQSKKVSDQTWLNRVVYFENATGIPGFVGAMWRHLDGLRNMRTSQTSWIHSLIKESENERIHLLIFLKTYRPGIIYRTGLLLSHFWYIILFSSMYLFFPRVTHRIVGHIEEQAIQTYTQFLDEINKENSPASYLKQQKANQLAKDYWNFDENATFEDILLYVRKDKERHVVVNHDLADVYKYKGYPEPKTDKVN